MCSCISVKPRSRAATGPVTVMMDAIDSSRSGRYCWSWTSCRADAAGARCRYAPRRVSSTPATTAAPPTREINATRSPSRSAAASTAKNASMLA